jgi:hypothetical protein
MHGEAGDLIGEYPNTHVTADWLAQHRYAYVSGTDGIWYRKETP